MLATKKFPTTEEELLELGGGLHLFPASFEEYLELIEKTELRAEYTDGQIVLMSLASDPHETLVGQLLFYLGFLQLTHADLTSRGSNRRIYVPGYTQSFSPDCFFVKGEATFFEPESKPKMNTNPWLVVEVLSPSTKAYDLGTKLSVYQSIPSTQYILYAQQDEAKVTLYQRQTANRWSSQDYDLDSPILRIADVDIDLRQIYQRLGLVE